MLTLSAVVVTPLVLALLVAMARFDAVDTGRRLVDWMQHTQQRTLRLDGTVRLGLLPRPALVLGRGILSRRNSAEEFATFDEARLNLAWGFLLGAPPQVTGIAIRGLRADLADAGGMAVAAENSPLPIALGEIDVERADLRYGDGGQVLHLERGQARLVGGALDAEGNGAGLGLTDLVLRLQSAPAGDARDLALGVNGLHGAEKFDLRLAVGRFRQDEQGFAAEDLNLVAQLTSGDDGFDVALRAPALAGSMAAAQAGKTTLAVNQIWKNGRLTLTYSGAARLGVAGAWLEWPAARLEVNLLEAGRDELFRTWEGASRFEAAHARAAEQ